MKKIYFTAVLLLFCIVVHAQKDSTNRDSTKTKIILSNAVSGSANIHKPDLAPLSPNAASFGKFGVIDISPFTGLANIDIDVFSLKAGDIPISGELRYFSGGVKPNEHSGWVGQNWSLNVGVAVTRKVKGGVDEVAASFLGPGNTTFAYLYNYSLLDVNDWFSDAKLPVISSTGAYDINLEPDEFMFILPNGETGSFFLNHEGKWVVKSKSMMGYKVTVEVGIDQELISVINISDRITINRIIYKITIIDMKGFKYTFGNTMDAIEFSRGARPANTTFFNNEDVIAVVGVFHGAAQANNSMGNFSRNRYQQMTKSS